MTMLGLTGCETHLHSSKGLWASISSSLGWAQVFVWHYWKSKWKTGCEKCFVNCRALTQMLFLLLSLSPQGSHSILYAENIVYKCIDLETGWHDQWISKNCLKPQFMHLLGERAGVSVSQSRTVGAPPGSHQVLSWALSVDLYPEQVTPWPSQPDTSPQLHDGFAYFNSTLGSNRDHFCLLGWCLRVRVDLFYYGTMGLSPAGVKSMPLNSSTCVNLLRSGRRLKTTGEEKIRRVCLLRPHGQKEGKIIYT